MNEPQDNEVAHDFPHFIENFLKQLDAEQIIEAIAKHKDAFPIASGIIEKIGVCARCGDKPVDCWCDHETGGYDSIGDNDD